MEGTMDLTAKTELELRAMEREIAKQHLDKFPYLSLAWGLGNLASSGLAACRPAGRPAGRVASRPAARPPGEAACWYKL